MVRQITLDENKVVTCCSEGGYIEGGIDVGDIPDEVMACPAKWKFEGGKFIPNEGYSDYSFGELKAEKIAESKLRLSEWLENNPMLYADGKHYSVTAEKQSLLNGNLASYERAKNIGISYPLKWNSTGDECTEWEYSELLKLSLTIAAYVAPKVSMQQSVELEIRACATLDELESIVISYE